MSLSVLSSLSIIPITNGVFPNVLLQVLIASQTWSQNPKCLNSELA